MLGETVVGAVQVVQGRPSDSHVATQENEDTLSQMPLIPKSIESAWHVEAKKPTVEIKRDPFGQINSNQSRLSVGQLSLQDMSGIQGSGLGLALTTKGLPQKSPASIYKIRQCDGSQSVIQSPITPAVITAYSPFAVRDVSESFMSDGVTPNKSKASAGANHEQTPGPEADNHPCQQSIQSEIDVTERLNPLNPDLTLTLAYYEAMIEKTKKEIGAAEQELTHTKSRKSQIQARVDEMEELLMDPQELNPKPPKNADKEIALLDREHKTEIQLLDSLKEQERLIREGTAKIMKQKGAVLQQASRGRDEMRRLAEEQKLLLLQSLDESMEAVLDDAISEREACDKLAGSVHKAMREEEHLKNEVKQEKARWQQSQLIRTMYLAENEALTKKKDSVNQDELNLIKSDLIAKCSHVSAMLVRQQEKLNQVRDQNQELSIKLQAAVLPIGVVQAQGYTELCPRPVTADSAAPTPKKELPEDSIAETPAKPGHLDITGQLQQTSTTLFGTWVTEDGATASCGIIFRQSETPFGPGPVMVDRVTSTSPSAKSLAKGDRLRSIDEVSLNEIPSGKLMELLKGSIGSVIMFGFDKVDVQGVQVKVSTEVVQLHRQVEDPKDLLTPAKGSCPNKHDGLRHHPFYPNPGKDGELDI